MTRALKNIKLNPAVLHVNLRNISIHTQIPESELLDTFTNNGSRYYVHILRALTLQVRA